VAIKWRAFKMLALGTAMVIYFSVSMVDVMQAIAVRCNLSPFYVSFILAPLVSNASEVIASQYYASKKTRKTITSISLSALEGAASMNNTVWLVLSLSSLWMNDTLIVLTLTLSSCFC
jgi:Ca2+/H+ antiporter